MEPKTDEESFAVWLNRQAEYDGKCVFSSGCPASLDMAASNEIKRLLGENSCDYEPVRGFLDDETTWRHGKPNYSLVNLAYLKGKLSTHMKDSLEMIVENAVKTWEMEASHKTNTDQWETVVHDKYNVQSNFGKVFGLHEASKRGNYNVLLDSVDKELYCAANEDFDSSHHLFENAFRSCFPWEVLDVFTGPPNIVFSWRHWGEFTGDYKGNKGNGELLELDGFAAVSVTEDLKITAIKVFHNPDPFLKALRGENSCPWIEQANETSDDFMEDEMQDRESWNIRNARTVEPDYPRIKLSMESKILFIGNLYIARDSVFEYNGEHAKLAPLPVDKPLRLQFRWKLTEVFAEAPIIAFTWIHSNNEAASKAITKKLEGFAIVELNENKAVRNFKVFSKLNLCEIIVRESI